MWRRLKAWGMGPGASASGAFGFEILASDFWLLTPDFWLPPSPIYGITPGHPRSGADMAWERDVGTEAQRVQSPGQIVKLNS